MDFKITNYDVLTEQIYLEQTAEMPIDIDFTLSDFDGDIKKILNCEIIPYTTEKYISGNIFSVEGEAILKVIYCTNEGQIYSTEQEFPFKKSFESEKNIEGGYGTVKTYCTVHSCRAVTERKISIRSSLKLEATVTVIEKNKIISDIDCSGFEQLKGESFATIPLGKTQKNIIVDEEIVLPQNLPAAYRVIRSSVVSNITDCKIVADKTIIKGNLKATIFYCTEENEYYKHTVNIPFNQIVDIPGINEFCESSATSFVCGHNISARSSNDSEGRKFMLICKVEISVLARCSNNIPIIYDVYSTNYATTHKSDKVVFPKLAKQINEVYICKKTLSLSNSDNNEILDIWCKCGNISVKFSENTAVIFGNILANVLYKNSDNYPEFFERIIEFEYPVNFEEKILSPKCSPEVIVSDCDFSLLNSGQPEIKLELIFKIDFYDICSHSVITELEVDENSPITNKASLIAYYADKGEDVWKIAKSFSAKRSEFLKINHLTEETVASSKMLLIPLM